MDQTFIETAIFGLYKIDLLNLIKVKASLAKEFHIQPSEIDIMTVWEYELFMKELNNMVKEQNKQNEDDMNKSGYNRMNDPNYLSRMQKSYMKDIKTPKMPSMPKI